MRSMVEGRPQSPSVGPPPSVTLSRATFPRTREKGADC
jgi:hypothetical protein